MEILQKLNLYFGYEAKTMTEFISDFKEDYEGDDEEAMKALLNFFEKVMC